jgi:hypothetical protein
MCHYANSIFYLQFFKSKGKYNEEVSLMSRKLGAVKCFVQTMLSNCKSLMGHCLNFEMAFSAQQSKPSARDPMSCICRGNGEKKI